MALDPNKVFEAQSGFRVLDGVTEGPIYTGGPVSPVGLDFPIGTLYVENSSTGPMLWKKYGSGVNDWTKTIAGGFYQSSQAAAETSTTSTTTFLNKCTITTPVLPLGDYLISWRHLWRAANANRFIDIRLQRASANITNYQQFTASVIEIQNEAGFLRQNGISGAQTITLDFKVSGSATTVFMKEAILEFWRVV